jgi:hypothetical protein
VSAHTGRHRRQAEPAPEPAALPGLPPAGRSGRRGLRGARTASVVVMLLVAAAGTFAVVPHLPASTMPPQAAPPAETLGRAAAQAGTLVSKTEVSKVLAATDEPAVTPKTPASPAPRSSTPPAPPPLYLNPLRAITDLIPQRVDMGVDFAGAGPVYALGDAVITNAEGDNAGWPGGGWITYQLTDGPAAGLMVYVAEDVLPVVQVGEVVDGYRRDGQRRGWHRDRVGHAGRLDRRVAAGRRWRHRR